MFSKKIVIFGFRLFILIFCFYGVMTSLFEIPGKINWKTFWFYTTLSNMYVFIYFLVNELHLAFRWKKITASQMSLCPQLKGSVTITILTTFFVYNLLLAPKTFQTDGPFSYFGLLNLSLHVIVPLLVLLDWILFDIKGLFKKKSLFIWFLPLASYFAIIVLRAQLSAIPLDHKSLYPYYFIDINNLGTLKVVVNAFFISLGYIAMSYLYYFIDQHWGRKEKQNRNA